LTPWCKSSSAISRVVIAPSTSRTSRRRTSIASPCNLYFGPCADFDFAKSRRVARCRKKRTGHRSDREPRDYPKTPQSGPYPAPPEKEPSSRITRCVVVLEPMPRWRSKEWQAIMEYLKSLPKKKRLGEFVPLVMERAGGRGSNHQLACVKGKLPGSPPSAPHRICGPAVRSPPSAAQGRRFNRSARRHQGIAAFCAGFSDAGSEEVSTCSGGRRLKKRRGTKIAGSRGTVGAAGSMGIWPRGIRLGRGLHQGRPQSLFRAGVGVG